jgi:hypothetical protein
LKENKDNVIWPIKLLLILALRLVNVHAKTVDEVLQLASQRRDKTVIWAHPTRHVLCAFGSCGQRIEPDKPAGHHQLRHTMGEVGLKAGFLARILSHDLRGGTARDVANLDNPVKRHATPAVAAVLGHSEIGRIEGTAKTYVGCGILVQEEHKGGRKEV